MSRFRFLSVITVLTLLFLLAIPTPRFWKLSDVSAANSAQRADDHGGSIGNATQVPSNSVSFGAGPVHDDGDAIRLADGGLAGSNLSLDRAVRNVQTYGAMNRIEAIAAATLRPARLLGIESERGTLRPGARADFAILDPEDNVHETWIAGERVFARS